MGKQRKHPEGWGKQISLRLLGETWYEVLPLRNESFCPIVNLDELWTLVSEQTWVKWPKTSRELLLSPMWCNSGFYKVLGKVKLSKQHVNVKVKVFSRNDKENMGGGCCVLVA